MTQNWIAFIVPLDSGTWESLYVFTTDSRPTNQEVCNAIVGDGKNPLLYSWEVLSLR